PRSLYSETTIENHLAAIDHLDGRSLIAPIETARQLTPEDGLFTALGLSIRLPPAMSARIEWRVSWTAFLTEGGGPTPIGVGNLPVITLEDGDLTVEIERGLDSIAPSPSDLLDAIAARTSQALAETGMLSLTSGERAVWATSGDTTTRSAALAWTCGVVDDGRFSRYVASIHGTDAAAHAELSRLAATVRCTVDTTVQQPG
ncbi:MAG: hypothetical protein OEM62_12090, partial [Acidobacteriota bacterium]|nr:hypothetical protein [Acidobacteriota bacterium]